MSGSMENCLLQPLHQFWVAFVKPKDAHPVSLSMVAHRCKQNFPWCSSHKAPIDLVLSWRSLSYLQCPIFRIQESLTCICIYDIIEIRSNIRNSLDVSQHLDFGTLLIKIFQMQKLYMISRLGYIITRYSRHRCFQCWPGLSNGLGLPDQCLWLTLSSLQGP